MSEPGWTDLGWLDVDGLLEGETVVVIQRAEVGRGAGNTPIYTTVEETVDNVLISPASTDDVIESNRPDGTELVWNLDFPKTFTGPLRGCRVRVRGEEFHVVGDPRPYLPTLTPGQWNRPVKVERREG